MQRIMITVAPDRAAGRFGFTPANAAKRKQTADRRASLYDQDDARQKYDSGQKIRAYCPALAPRAPSKKQHGRRQKEKRH